MGRQQRNGGAPASAAADLKKGKPDSKSRPFGASACNYDLQPGQHWVMTQTGRHVPLRRGSV